ncbi:hypothetical protein C7S13_3245 [Burkholderia cepacia]|nr:hypothetical protein [Burkholderia cepacia]
MNHAAPVAVMRGRRHPARGGAGLSCAAVFPMTTQGPRSVAQTARAYSA